MILLMTCANLVCNSLSHTTSDTNSDSSHSDSWFLIVKKHGETGMLPLECPYLNKTALFTVVGPQVKTNQFQHLHFFIDSKPFHHAVASNQTFYSEEKAKIGCVTCRAITEINRRSEQLKKESCSNSPSSFSGYSKKNDRHNTSQRDSQSSYWRICVTSIEGWINSDWCWRFKFLPLCWPEPSITSHTGWQERWWN